MVVGGCVRTQTMLVFLMWMCLDIDCLCGPCSRCGDALTDERKGQEGLEFEQASAPTRDLC